MSIKVFKQSLVASICITAFFFLAHIGWQCMERSNEGIFKVRGIAERIVKADRVVWFVTADFLDNRIEDALKSCQAVKAQFLEFCAKEGIEKDFKPEFSTISVTDNWASNHNRNDPIPLSEQNSQKNSRYKITLKLVVESLDVDKVCQADTKLALSISSVALKGDANYYYTKFDKLREVMSQESFQSALKIATALGKTSNMRIGRVKDLSQGMFTISTPNNPENDWSEKSSEKSSIIKIIRTVSSVTFAARAS
jgi:hypothetical protein